MAKCFLAACLSVLFTGFIFAGDGPIAHWKFDEGTGTQLRDSAGKSHGRIHGAKWIKSGKGHALSFDGDDAFVDCGDTPALDLREKMTIEAWIKPDAPPQREPGVLGKGFTSYLLTYYKSGSVYFYIKDGGNGTEGPVKVGTWSHVAATFDGKTLRFFVNGVEKASRDSKYNEIARGGKFWMGVVPGDPSATDAAMRNTEHFRGALDEVKVYNVARTARQIAESYNEIAPDKGLTPITAAEMQELLVEIFPYPERKQMVVSADFSHMSGLGEQATATLHLKRTNGEPVQTKNADIKAPIRQTEFVIDSSDLPAGTYTAQVSVQSGTATKEADASVQLPIAETPLPSPAEMLAAPLPPPTSQPSFEVQVSPQEALSVGVIPSDKSDPFGFGPVGGSGPRPIVTGDFNNNGKTDVLYREGDAGGWYASEYAPAGVQPGPDLVRVGNEFATPFGSTPSQGIVIGDYNNDGKNDVLSADGSDRWRAQTMTPGAVGADAITNNGSTGPAIVLEAASLRKIMIADINNDGLQDFLYRETDGASWYYRTYAPDTSTPDDLTDAIQQNEISLINNPDILIGDYNNDGLNDVVFALGSSFRAWTIMPDNSTGPMFEFTDGIGTANEFKFITNYNNQTAARKTLQTSRDGTMVPLNELTQATSDVEVKKPGDPNWVKRSDPHAAKILNVQSPAGKSGPAVPVG